MRNPIPFGRHLLLERINVGGMAEVFRAKSFGVEGFERIVAVKRILPQMAEDPDFVRMFKDEANLAQHLTHQNIVQIHELGKENGIYYIAMEYVMGRDLRALLDRFKRDRLLMDEGMACHVVSQICAALDYAHRKSDFSGRSLDIIHRDVSPQNVLVSFVGEVKLCDFGIAKAVTQSTRTQAGVLKGKFAYMSPEQVRGKRIDRRSDLFALGVIFYEMLTGERLFLGESDFSTLDAVRAARVPNPRKFNRELPRRLEEILLKLLARDPDQRYQWASEVYDDLHGHLVASGRVFHAHHLRQFMQETYEREIRIENAKLEEGMRARPPPELLAPRPPPAFSEVPAPAARGPSLPPPAPRPDSGETGGFAAIPGLRPAPGRDPSTTERGLPVLSEPPGQVVVSRPPSEPRAGGGRVPSHQDEEHATVMADEVSVGEAPAGQTVEGLPGSVSARARSLHAEIQAAQQELIERLEAEGLADADEGETMDVLTAGTDGELSIPLPSVIDDAERTVDGESSAQFPLDGPDTAHPPTEHTQEETHDPTQEAVGGRLVDWDAVAGALERAEDPAELSSEDDPGTDAEPPEERTAAPRPAPRRVIRETQRPNSLGVPRPPRPRDVTPAAPARALTPPPRGFGSDVVPIDQVSGPHVVPARNLGDPRVLMGLAAVVALVTILLLVLVVIRARPSGASIDITTTPTEQAEVSLNGRKLADRTPAHVEDLEVGHYVLDVRAPGFRPYHQEFDIVEQRPHTLTIPLDPLPPGEAPVVAPRLPEGAAGSGAPPAGSTAAPPPTDAAPDAGQASAWSLRVTSSPQGAAVTIDGRLAGTTPLTWDALSMAEPAQVVVELAGYRPFRQTVAPPPEAETTALLRAPLELLAPPPARPLATVPPSPRAEPAPEPKPRAEPRRRPPAPEPKPAPRVEPKPRAPPPAEPKPRPEPSRPAPRAAPPPVESPKPSPGEAEKGFLLITTIPAGAAVEIDGKPTGLKTPVRHPHPVPPGRHRVVLVTEDGKKHEFDVNIAPGAPTKLVKRLR